VTDTAPPPTTISLIRAAGRTRELEAIARRAIDRVREGAPAPASVAVIVRSLEVYGPLAREVFPRFGLPFRVEAGRTLDACPIVRAAMAFARLQGEDYSYRALSRLLKSNYFTARAFGADDATARAAVRLAREANVWAGRDRYRNGLIYLRNRIVGEAQAVDEAGDPVLSPDAAVARRQEIDRAGIFLKRLFADLTLPAQDTRRAMAGAFRKILRDSGLWTAAAGNPSEEGRARDTKALAALEQVLEEVALLDAAEAARVPLSIFLDEVTQGLALATIASEEPADAPVVVLSARDARGLAFDHVFLAGLAEKEFPRRGRQHPFFDDAQRTDLRERNVDLADTGHDAEQEMLLFYMAAASAGESLTLSWPSLDSQGRPALASHYLEELTSLFTPGPDGQPLPTEVVGTRDLDLPADRLRTPGELLASTMFSVWGPDPAHHDGDGAAASAPPSIDNKLAILDALLARGPAAEAALAGLAAEWDREHGDAFSTFDGLLSASDILDELCRRFPGKTTMSARRLELFGGCPFAFFAGEILGLKTIEEPSPDLGPLEVGLIYHGLLERFFSALAASESLAGRVTDATRGAAMELLDSTAAAYFAGLEAHGRVGSPALWDVQKRNILRDVRRLIDWHVEKLGDWRAAYTEVPFGARASEAVAPPGRHEPLTLDGPHGPVAIRGRIDRIDLTADGTPGHQVIDYKTGAPPSRRAMQNGTSFQLPIYLWAAEAMLPPDERGGLAQAFFLPVRRPAMSAKLASLKSKGEPNEKFAAAMDAATAYIHRFIDAMRRGHFPVYPRDGCPGHCDMGGICRYAQWRIDRKWREHPIDGLEPIVPAAEDSGDEEARA
jgi:ATP-dependent helicase/nuclease subunit B